MTRIQIRRDTSSNWATYNPVLADGEFALETDTRKLKIGNGEQPYNDLAYQEGETYTLPPATADTLGGIKVGENLTITEDGVLNATGSAPANVVTTNTAQTITGQKVFRNSFVTSDGTATTGNRVLINNARIDLIPNLGAAAKIDSEGIDLRGGINSSGLTIQSSDRIVTFGQNNTPMRIYAIALERYSNANDNGAIILDAKNYKNYTYTKKETDELLDAKQDIVYPIGRPMPEENNVLLKNEIWLEGATVNIVDYPKLFKVYGTKYGGDGTTTFKLPDMRGRTLWGSPDGSNGYIEAKLPNIKGSLKVYLRFEETNAGGAFKLRPAYTDITNVVGQYYDASNITDFDASLSNPIYSDDATTVQPPAFKVRWKTRFE